MAALASSQASLRGQKKYSVTGARRCVSDCSQWAGAVSSEETSGGTGTLLNCSANCVQLAALQMSTAVWSFSKATALPTTLLIVCMTASCLHCKPGASSQLATSKHCCNIPGLLSAWTATSSCLTLHGPAVSKPHVRGAEPAGPTKGN